MVVVVVVLVVVVVVVVVVVEVGAAVVAITVVAGFTESVVIGSRDVVVTLSVLCVAPSVVDAGTTTVVATYDREWG